MNGHSGLGLSLPLGAAVAVAGIAGLLVGSFLNVLVYRLPRGLSITAPRSFCPTCTRQLSWWENVPVLAWLLLRGRCHSCHQPISVRYPLVELATGVAFALTTWAWHGSALAIGYCALAAATIALVLITYDGQQAPPSVAWVGTGIGLAVTVLAGTWQFRWDVVVGSVTGTIIAAALYAAWQLHAPGTAGDLQRGEGVLLVLGCWIGGLGPSAAAVGLALGALAYAACLVVVRAATRSAVPVGGGALIRSAHPVLRNPLPASVVVAMIASLAAGR